MLDKFIRCDAATLGLFKQEVFQLFRNQDFDMGQTRGVVVWGL